jgi:peptide subunit release factor 1 (eRF1)
VLDFDKLTVTFDCPKCGFPNEATTREFGDGTTIICRGCKEDIRLGDKDGSVKKAKKDLDQVFDELEQAVGKTIKINLTL